MICFSECSPIREETAPTRFQWAATSEFCNEKWTAPGKNTKLEAILNAVKAQLLWTGEDKDMKRSPQMKTYT